MSDQYQSNGLKDTYDEIKRLAEEIDTRRNTLDVSRELIGLSPEAQDRDIFSRLLRGENIDSEFLRKLLQEMNHESKSDTK